MSLRLTETMRHSAETVPAYVDYDTVLTRVRRRRRRQRFAALATVAVLVFGAGLVPLVAPVVTNGSVAGALDGRATLPDRVGAPLWGTASVERQPLRAASVVFTSRVWWPEGAVGEVALVGAEADDYRLVYDPGLGVAGEQVLVSPDGSRVAMSDQVVRLADGQRRALPRLPGFETTVPAAWSPRGDALAVLGTTVEQMSVVDGTNRTTRAVLGLVDVASGRYSTIAELVPVNVVDGFTVAFAPDGRTLAYQSGAEVVVADLAGTVRSRFTVPADTRPAGKGAWTPDGQGVTLVTQRRCCDGDGYAARWQLRVVDPASGVERRVLPEQPGLVALRLLGWSPDGAAMVARYHPEPDAEVVGFGTDADPYDPYDGLTDAEWVSRADVAAIRPGVPPRVLVKTAQDDVQGVDVADGVIASGETRPGRPPSGLGPYTKLLLAGVLLVLAVLLVGTIVLVRLVRAALRDGGSAWLPGRSVDRRGSG